MLLPIPAGPFRAYLFDCDGTIVDSMPLHYIAWKTALDEWRCPFPEELFYAWGGKPVDEILSTLNAAHGLAMPVDAVAIRKEGLYFDLLPQFRAIPEVVEHIECSVRTHSLRCSFRRASRLGHSIPDRNAPD